MLEEYKRADTDVTKELKLAEERAVKLNRQQELDDWLKEESRKQEIHDLGKLIERRKQEKEMLEQKKRAKESMDRIRKQHMELNEKQIHQVEVYIRTSKRFNSKNPDKCKVNIPKLFLKCNGLFPTLPVFLNWLKCQSNFIVHENNTDLVLRYKTPYQGDDRRYGHFHCRSCNRRWTSGHSWKDCGQRCQDCEMFIYPHTQDPLISNKSNHSVSPHDVSRCEKCIQLGHSCT
jgi:hypothetical protein